mmetsp:Transcript_16628/g.27222  ORF Transcript_16628/g.27222 Transcript_16628/m.27222 type:complete len:314 (+) Transcript_16628:135-1076(+)
MPRIVPRHEAHSALVRCHPGFEVVDAGAAFDELRVGHQLAVQRDVGLDALDHRLAQRDAHACQGLIAGVAVDDDLADHAVVVRRHEVVRVGMRVHAHAGAAGGVPHRDAAGRGRELDRVFRVDAALDGMALEFDLALRERQLLAGGDLDLLLHDVDARHQFRHRVLHLQPGVHLQEVEVLLRVAEHLHRARAVVVHPARQPHGLLLHGQPRGRVDHAGGRLLDDLLVAPLDGALALGEGGHRAVLVRQDVDLDVVRVLDELLDEHAVVAEAAARLLHAQPVAGHHLLVVPGDAHALAAAAGRGLDHHRVADFP